MKILTNLGVWGGGNNPNYKMAQFLKLSEQFFLPSILKISVRKTAKLRSKNRIKSHKYFPNQFRSFLHEKRERIPLVLEYALAMIHIDYYNSLSLPRKAL